MTTTPRMRRRRAPLPGPAVYVWVPEGLRGTGKEKEERNREIVRLRADGWTMVDIGRRFGITKQRVHQILRREMAATGE